MSKKQSTSTPAESTVAEIEPQAAPTGPSSPEETPAQPCPGCVELQRRLDALESLVLEQAGSIERIAHAGALGDQQLASAIEALCAPSVSPDGLEARVAALESATPSAAALSVPALQQALKANPYAELRVLAAWDHASAGAMSEGRTFRADQMPRIVDWVQAGLKVSLS